MKNKLRILALNIVLIIVLTSCGSADTYNNTDSDGIKEQQDESIQETQELPDEIKEALLNYEGTYCCNDTYYIVIKDGRVTLNGQQCEITEMQTDLFASGEPCFYFLCMDKTADFYVDEYNDLWCSYEQEEGSNELYERIDSDELPIFAEDGTIRTDAYTGIDQNAVGTIFPEEVYEKGFLALTEDETQFVPETDDYLLLYETDQLPSQSAELMSFDEEGRVVQYIERYFNYDETFGNTYELIDKKDRIESINGEDCPKQSTLEEYYDGLRGYFGDIECEEMYYSKSLTPQQTTRNNHYTESDCQSLHYHTPTTDDFYIDESRPSYHFTTLDGKIVPYVDVTPDFDWSRVGYTDMYYTLAYVVSYKEDGSLDSFYNALIFDSEADAIDFVFGLTIDDNEFEYDSIDGNVIVLGDDADKNSFLHQYKQEIIGIISENDIEYYSKPYMTNEQISLYEENNYELTSFTN